mmetsp:Transcript_129836/g.225660  ORF Transcript_129836/g.225660 Transcript_129836/m.225660 type:complete len:403 (+) Transcript_129836:106-1314(+)
MPRNAMPFAQNIIGRPDPPVTSDQVGRFLAQVVRKSLDICLRVTAVRRFAWAETIKAMESVQDMKTFLCETACADGHLERETGQMIAEFIEDNQVEALWDVLDCPVGYLEQTDLEEHQEFVIAMWKRSRAVGADFRERQRMCQKFANARSRRDVAAELFYAVHTDTNFTQDFHHRMQEAMAARRYDLLLSAFEVDENQLDGRTFADPRGPDPFYSPSTNTLFSIPSTTNTVFSVPSDDGDVYSDEDFGSSFQSSMYGQSSMFHQSSMFFERMNQGVPGNQSIPRASPAEQAPPRQMRWTCPDCDEPNSESRRECNNCGRPRVMHQDSGRQTRRESSPGAEQDAECPVCMSNAPDRLLPCRHAMCSTCLHQWAAQHSHNANTDGCFPCPMCRALTAVEFTTPL